MSYLIWSFEHNAWWKPNHRGYTTDATKAGVYTFDEAATIVVPHIPPGEEVAVDVRYTARWIDYLASQGDRNHT